MTYISVLLYGTGIHRKHRVGLEICPVENNGVDMGSLVDKGG